MRLRRQARSGLSLLEVIIALATFLFSLVGLTFILGVGSNSALEAQYRSQGISICQSKMAEVGIGHVALESQSEVPCDDDPAFTWSLDAQPGAGPGLYNVTVRATRKRPNGTPVEVSLSQMILDPKMMGSIHDARLTIEGTTTQTP